MLMFAGVMSQERAGEWAGRFQDTSHVSCLRPLSVGAIWPALLVSTQSRNE
jgi:hypothetical protein